MNLSALLYPRQERTVHHTRGWVAAALGVVLLLAGCDLGSSSTPSVATPTSVNTQQVAPATAQASSTALPIVTEVQATATPQPVPPTDTAAATEALPTAVPIQPTATTAVAPIETPVPPKATNTVAPRPTASPTRRAATPTRVPPSATPRPTNTSAPVAPATATRTRPTATFTPSAAQRSQIEVIAQGFGSPDDLVVTPSGDILFGDFGNNAVNIIRPGQAPVVLASGVNEPEGMVIARDGAIILAEQKTNRILEIDPQTGQKKMLRQLVNNTGQDGVDGLGIDPATGDILIPDSPNGRLLRMSRDGTKLTTIANGFVRPTGAAVEPGGTIVVADEFGNAVYRLNANGTKTRLASMYQPDDVIVGPDGTIYANGLGGDIVAINPATKEKRVIVSGLKLPHGLGMDSQGRLVIAEAGRNRIFRVLP